MPTISSKKRRYNHPLYTRNTIWKSADALVAFDQAIGKLIGIGIFLPLFCVVDLEMSSGLMPAARELMMLSRLLIVSGVEHAMLNIGVNLCLLMLRHKGSVIGRTFSRIHV